MTDDDTTTDAPEQAVEPAEGTAEATEPAEGVEGPEADDAAGDADDTPRPRNREAQYRLRAKEAEAAAAALSEQLASVQRRLVLDAVGGQLHEPSAVLDREGGLGDLVDEHGYPDPDKVQAAVAEVIAAKPYLSTAPKTPTQRPGRRGQAVRAGEANADGMAAIFRGIAPSLDDD